MTSALGDVRLHALWVVAPQAGAVVYARRYPAAAAGGGAGNDTASLPSPAPARAGGLPSVPALRVPFDEEVVEALARAGVGRGGECAAPAVQAETDASCETDPLAHAVAWVPAAGAWPVVFACCGGLTIAALPMVPPEARSEAVAGSQGARRRVQGATDCHSGGGSQKKLSRLCLAPPTLLHADIHASQYLAAISNPAAAATARADALASSSAALAAASACAQLCADLASRLAKASRASSPLEDLRAAAYDMVAEAAPLGRLSR